MLCFSALFAQGSTCATADSRPATLSNASNGSASSFEHVSIREAGEDGSGVLFNNLARLTLEYRPHCAHYPIGTQHTAILDK